VAGCEDLVLLAILATKYPVRYVKEHKATFLHTACSSDGQRQSTYY
jgi:hypothetical protein